MKPEHVEALAALFDGEHVNPSVLTDALRDREAPALLADFASLRVIAQADAERPDDEFYARMAPVLRQHRLRRVWTSLAWPALAASLLLLAGLAGYWVGPPPDTAPPIVLESPRTRLEPAPFALPAVPLGASPPAVEPVPGVPASPGGPPTPALRLRFSQWSLATATVQPH
jgi:hypothetical protein